MLVETVSGNLLAGSEPVDPDSIDWLDLTWDQCLRRAISKPTRGRRNVKILLRLGSPVLRHGDVLFDAPDAPQTRIAINIVECSLVIAGPRALREWTSLAYELGDLHIPMRLEADRIITIDDGPVLGILDRLSIPYRTEVGRFEPTHGTSPSVVPISESFRMIRSA